MTIHKNKTLFISILVALIAIVGLIVFNPGNRLQEKVPVLAEYPNKKVYTVDAAFDTEILIQDCENAGGEFNTCGSPCGPDEDVCTAVCAYTCDF